MSNVAFNISFPNSRATKRKHSGVKTYMYYHSPVTISTLLLSVEGTVCLQTHVKLCIYMKARLAHRASVK